MANPLINSGDAVLVVYPRLYVRIYSTKDRNHIFLACTQ